MPLCCKALFTYNVFSIADLPYPTGILQLIGVSATDPVTVGTQIQFSCISGSILNATLDPEMNGYDVSAQDLEMIKKNIYLLF